MCTVFSSARGVSDIPNLCLNELTIVHFIELDHLNDRFLCVVFRVRGLPPPQGSGAAAIMDEGTCVA